ncbi:unannotated protein [freshwater metagenome]|uniref:Unannotated protein n=1 Tax=freshwater metagenome TaxID=449393 RepID=A0A6J7HX58_9ZZZZ|nr:glycosyltransferase [Actinomycetota bacterium]
MPELDICTIVARNYLPQARVLARSHAEHHPGARCFVLVIDDDGSVDAQAEPFELVAPADLRLDAYDEMRAAYDVLEFATSLKPWLLRHLLEERGCAAGLAYLDPDIRIFAPLGPVEEALRDHPVVLTPHLAGPLPRDGRRPSEADILVAGFFNLGFVALKAGADADRLLDWWAERLLTDCRNAPAEGIFVDQRWMDLAPSFLPDLAVLRDPACNLAYWNILGRELTVTDGRYAVDGHPLRFLHLSGYDPARPFELSRHQDRVRLSDEPVLRELCDGYRAALLEEGWDAACAIPYGNDVLPSGMALTPLLREAYRDGRSEGMLPASIFTPAGEAEFVAWLNERDPQAPRVTRLLQRAWAERSDMRHAFPDLGDERDARGFLRWVADHGSSELAIPEALIPAEALALRSAGAQLPPVDTVRDGVPGVNVAGYLRAELGIGEIARQMVAALDAAGVPAAPIELNAPASRAGHPFAGLDAERPPLPVNLICVNADGVPRLAREVGEQFFEGRHNIGLWWWETNAFPAEYDEAFGYVDEIWAGTSFVAQTLAAAAPVPVVHIPMPIAVAPTHPLAVGELGWPADFTFLYAYDYNSTVRRKNPVAAVRAFTTAFAEGEGPVLVLKSINADKQPDQHAEVLDAIGGRTDIVILGGYLDAPDRDRLMASCDCYVSLHRCEGLGLTIAEAMYLGKPVIATGYSGNMDYMTAANSLAVDFTMIPVGEGAWPYPADGEWAEPDVEHAARLMRQVFDDPQAAAALGVRAAADMRAGHSLLVTGRAAEARLRRIAPRLAGGARAPLPSSARAGALIAAGSAPRVRARGGKAGAALRRIVLRAIRPYTYWQEEINRALSDDARALDRRVNARVSALHATALGRLREQERQLEALRAELAARPVPSGAVAEPQPSTPARPASGGPRVTVVTVGPNAQLAHVRVLARSLARTNPGTPCVWVLTDEPYGLPDVSGEPIELLVAADLAIPGMRELAFEHDRDALAAVLTPAAIEHVLRRDDVDAVVLLRPATFVAGPLDPITAPLVAAPLVLTPHMAEPATGPDALERELFASVRGVFNAGVVAVADVPEALEALRWWDEQVRADCVDDPHRGLYYEQRHLDLTLAVVPGLHVLRDRGVNIGHWNLAERAPRLAGGRVEVDGRSATVVHFSGYDPERPDLATIDRPAVTLASFGPAADIYRLYREELLDAGARDACLLPYAYDAFDDGAPVTDAVRDLHRRLGRDAARFGDPFATGPGTFRAWMAQPAGDDGVSRFWDVIWRERPDLQALYPQHLGEDHEAFLDWVDHAGRTEYAVPWDV